MDANERSRKYRIKNKDTINERRKIQRMSKRQNESGQSEEVNFEDVLQTKLNAMGTVAEKRAYLQGQLEIVEASNETLALRRDLRVLYDRYTDERKLDTRTMQETIEAHTVFIQKLKNLKKKKIMMRELKRQRRMALAGQSFSSEDDIVDRPPAPCNETTSETTAPKDPPPLASDSPLLSSASSSPTNFFSLASWGSNDETTQSSSSSSSPNSYWNLGLGGGKRSRDA